MSRLRELLGHFAGVYKFNAAYCVICLASGAVTLIFLSIWSFRSFDGTGNYHDLTSYLMVAITALNVVTTVLFVRTVFKRRKQTAEGKSPKSSVVAELFAAEEMKKSTFALIISFVVWFLIMFINHKLALSVHVSDVWLVIILVPAGLSCLNTFLINVRVTTGEFGFNSLEGMEIINLLKKRRIPPGGGGPKGIFRDLQERYDLQGVQDVKDVRTA